MACRCGVHQFKHLPASLGSTRRCCRASASGDGGARQAGGNGQLAWTARPFLPFKSTVLYVKRRSGHVPHAAGPAGVRGVLARSLAAMRGAFAVDDTDADDGTAAAAAVLAALFAADARVAAFVRVWAVPARLSPLVTPPPGATAAAAAATAAAAAAAHMVLPYEAQSGDPPDVLFAAVELLDAAARLRPPPPLSLPLPRSRTAAGRL